MQLIHKTALDKEYIERVLFLLTEYANRHRAVIARTIVRIVKGELTCPELFPLSYVLFEAKRLKVIDGATEEKLANSVAGHRYRTYGASSEHRCLLHIDAEAQFDYAITKSGAPLLILRIPSALALAKQDFVEYVRISLETYGSELQVVIGERSFVVCSPESTIEFDSELRAL